ncbi:TonB-dependent receptor [Hymenobacter taeanensis]|uniref:TonB-dependent receptor n=1 Tax=Hymenobacter taeanensis TaxID=2735321 RepID=A0A6M6BGS6_9BACT|nr:MULTISPECIES: TonB-dependent receptor [Hymenobacter]QJX47058.1 TonB-dependent receptor [Hymenobacter taeanensis]UOQ80936.1 TonB-dependent receptor [Hymenobacter sp. 5414T-23]
MLFRVPGAPDRFRCVWLLLLLWSTATVALGQSGTCALSLSGRISDHESRGSLASATVVVLETQQATQTEADGHYHFELCPGTYHVQVSFVGFTPETAEVRLGPAVVRDFKLHPDAILLQGATVNGQHVEAPTLQATATLSEQALQQTRGQTLGEALQKVTGVTAIQTGPSIFKPMIHGLHSNRVTILNNGVRQEGQQWGQEHGPEIDPFIASKLTVVKGAASVRYGSDAIGGVVLVQPKALRDSAGTGGELNLVGMSNNGLGAASGTIEGNLAKLPALSWRVQGTAKRAGTMRAPGYYLKNSGFEEYDYSGAVGWRKATYGLEVFYSQFSTKLGILPAAHAESPSDLSAAIARPRPLETTSFNYYINRAYQQVSHELLKLTGFVKTGSVGRLTATLGQQTDFRDEYDLYSARNAERAALNRPALSYSNRTTTGELVWEHKPLGHFTGSVGLAGTYQLNRYADGTKGFIPFYNNYVAGAFAIERWQQGKWQLEGGLRADYRHLQTRRGTRNAQGVYYVDRREFSYVTPAASLDAMYDPAAHLTLSLTTSLTQRAPAPNERFSDGVHNAQYELGYDLVPGNGALRPETAYHTALTANWHDNPRLNGEVTVYQTAINGFIYQQPILPPVINIRGTLISWQYYQTNATLRGLDIGLTYRLAPQWQLAGKASVVRGRDTKADQWQVFMPADRAELSVRYEAPDGNGRLTGRYVNLGGYAVARQTRVPDNYAAKDYALPPAGYALLGLETGATVHWGRLPLEVSVAGSNLLNQRYRDYLNRYRYFANEMGRNVTLRVRVPLEFGHKRQ